MVGADTGNMAGAGETMQKETQVPTTKPKDTDISFTNNKLPEAQFMGHLQQPNNENPRTEGNMGGIYYESKQIEQKKNLSIKN